MLNIISERAEDKYIESFLNRIIDCEDFDIAFTFDSSAKFTITRNKLPYTYDNSLPYFKEYKGTKIFSYGTPDIKITSNGITTNLDFVFSCFFFLSGYYEHVNNHIRDIHGRFPGVASFQVLHNIIETPVVNVYVKLMIDLLNQAGLKASIKPEYSSSFFFLSHDIDHLKVPSKDMLKEFLIKRNMKIAFKNLYDINRMILIEKEYGIKGSYYFRSPGDYSDGYSTIKNSRLIKEFAGMIKKISGNTGAHYNYGAIDGKFDHMQVKELESLLGKRPISGRHHYLRFDIDKSYDFFEGIGIKIDSSGSYADRVGFRFGTSWPFKPYNFKEKREYDLVEIPLVVMDGTLEGSSYMNFTPGKGLTKAKELLDEVRKHGGIFSLLWHNSSFELGKWKNWESVYHDILKYGKNKDMPFLTDIEIIDHFNL